MKKTVLITGAAGFLGSHLCDYLLYKSYKVLAIDNFITGNLKNLSHLQSNSDFEFRKIDITHNFNIDDSIDYILHFASPASPIDYLQIPLETLRVGSLGTENVLKIALKNKVRILLLPRQKYMEILWSILNRKNIVVMLILLVQEGFMMRLKGFKRHLLQLITLITGWIFELLGYLIYMGQE